MGADAAVERRDDLAEQSASHDFLVMARRRPHKSAEVDD
jgi:hypothetical protein